MIGSTPLPWRLGRLTEPPRQQQRRDALRFGLDGRGHRVDQRRLATPGGLRDRAIFLLLAPLGLRAGDIVTLCLGDIDWNNATMSVKGKSKYPARLPLPQDAGDAVADYILKAHPQVDEDRVFLRNLAPRHLPFASSAAISMIVRRAMRRTGIDADGLPAAHVFRHSIGTNLLRSGTPLEVIGTLGRRRSLWRGVVVAHTRTVRLDSLMNAWVGIDRMPDWRMGLLTFRAIAILFDDPAKVFRMRAAATEGYFASGRYLRDLRCDLFLDFDRLTDQLCRVMIGTFGYAPEIVAFLKENFERLNVSPDRRRAGVMSELDTGGWFAETIEDEAIYRNYLQPLAGL